MRSSSARRLLGGIRYHTSSQSPVYDVAIVGGGMVGLALAGCLQTDALTKGLRVAVIDRQFPCQHDDPILSSRLPEFPALRVSTLTPSSIDLLRRIGVWQSISPPVSAVFHDMQVWELGGKGFVRYDAFSVGQANMGHVVENSVLIAALTKTLQDSTSVHFIQGRSVESVAFPPYGTDLTGPPVEIRHHDGTSLRAKLIVGADGARSRIRDLAHIRTLGRDYGQRAVVATVKLADTDQPNRTAWQRFLPTGPLALLPVRGGYSNVVWSTTPELARALEACDPYQFAESVNSALHADRPPDTQTSSSFVTPPYVVDSVGDRPQSFPLMLRHAGRYVRPRLALVGDAAHAVHPLAGQGVNLGFGDVRVLACALSEALKNGTDVGDVSMLEERYERPRQRANGAMIAVLDGLARVFTPQDGPFAALRTMGLSMIQSSTMAKKAIMRYAMFGA